MFAPFKLREMELKNRIVVSPMAQYKAVDGCPTDWHLIHYGERAKGGAGLVFTEMTCVSAEGRITPGCPGLYAPEHEAAWRRLTDFVHAETSARICCQIGHSGRKGSTQLGWEQMDAPLKDGNWEIVSASAMSLVEGQRHPARDHPRRHGPRARRVCQRGRNGRSRRLRHDRDARRARLPAVVLHLAAVEHPQR
jgi:anthraniloyl-CoA monooxygenase